MVKKVAALPFTQITTSSATAVNIAQEMAATLNKKGHYLPVTISRNLSRKLGLEIDRNNTLQDNQKKNFTEKIHKSQIFFIISANDYRHIKNNNNKIYLHRFYIKFVFLNKSKFRI